MRDRDDASIDGTPTDGTPTDDTDGLVARLRAEAATERPAFSPELHARLLARIMPSPSPRPAMLRRRILPTLTGGIVAAVAAALVVMPANVRPPQIDRGVGVDEAAVMPAAPGIEQLPTFAEVGEDVVASLTAALVDLPPWIALVAVAPTEFMADEVMSSDGSP